MGKANGVRFFLFSDLAGSFAWPNSNRGKQYQSYDLFQELVKDRLPCVRLPRQPRLLPQPSRPQLGRRADRMEMYNAGGIE